MTDWWSINPLLRYDRSFTFLVDLERHDHFLYSVDLVSPRTNLSHAINFSTIQDLRVVRASMDMHNEFPTFDIKYRGTVGWRVPRWWDLSHASLLTRCRPDDLVGTLLTGGMHDCLISELRSCVKVEVAVLGSPSLVVLMVSVEADQHLNSNTTLSPQSPGAVWKSRWPSWAPRPMSLMVSVDVKQHWTMHRH